MLRNFQHLAIFSWIFTVWVISPNEMYGQLFNPRSNTQKAERKWEMLSRSVIPDDFVLFSGQPFLSMDNSLYFKVPRKDTNTLENVSYDQRRTSLHPFAISKYEVTNNQYKSFISWVVDSLALTILAQEDPSFYLDPMGKQLNWSRRKELRDSNLLSKLNSLYRYVPVISSKSGGKMEEAMKRELNPEMIRYEFRRGSKLGSGNIAIFPDTLCWYRDLNRENMFEPVFSNKYFSHPAYGIYPVVGVNWHQAQAFCDWISRFSTFEFRLPSSMEFKCAYLKPIQFSKTSRKSGGRSEELINSNNLHYPWGSIDLFDKHGKYFSNFGGIKDEYDYSVKGYGTDGGLWTTRTGAYPPSKSGLYDLAGNVAEWVSDVIIPQYHLSSEAISSVFKKSLDSTKKHDIYIERDDDLVAIIDKIFKYYITGSRRDSLAYEHWKEIGSPIFLSNDGFLFVDDLKAFRKPTVFIENDSFYDGIIRNTIEIASQYYHNIKVIRSFEEPRSVMGGSWQDPPIFLHFGVKRVYDANTSRSNIGFRVATDIILTPELQSMISIK